MTKTQRAILIVSGLVLLLVAYNCAFFPSYSSDANGAVGLVAFLAAVFTLYRAATPSGE